MPTLGTPLSLGQLNPGSCWQLQANINGYVHRTDAELSTQAAAGRKFQLLLQPLESELQQAETRVKVRLLEDGYPCWLNLKELLGQAIACAPWQAEILKTAAIQQRLPAIMAWVEVAASQTNAYLWGGTLGPDFDCSGLIQSAFVSQGIWLPRDAYQQEQFCTPVDIDSENLERLRPGDLLFFGTQQRCNHVALYRGDGLYWHSSGHEHGNNRIACDGLPLIYGNPVAAHYRSELRGGGRIERCHDGSTLP